MSSANRKCPLSGLFGTPPSINFFSSSSADTNIFLAASNAVVIDDDDNATVCEQFSPKVFASQHLQQSSSTTVLTDAEEMDDQLASFMAGTLRKFYFRLIYF